MAGNEQFTRDTLTLRGSVRVLTFDPVSLVEADFSLSLGSV